ncbi:aldo/keto reductase [Pseudooceanicola algae]|uniref:Putative oxidoreductase n=1 Tax=Pseudooceanicola algae TaxID=1537215 RepID=A0A418SCI9_9RHOB|nr:aldo/keto reductase [Pseudooceanicola algae]QPM90010.1 putative oxidoreductase [Pseudooceanicola algae]
MTDLSPLKFHDGHAIPRLGLGVWQVPEPEVTEIVKTAIGLGYRLIDGAKVYGNEEGMGKGIAQSGVAREDLFITSKVWNADQGYDAARRAIDGSLKRIGVDQLDLCLIHWPRPKHDLYVETWKALLAAKADGQILSAGVSNFKGPHIDRLVAETGEAPVLNQIELHPLFQQDEMRAENDRHGIVTQSWSPLGRSMTFEAPQIVAIAERTGKTPAQVILRWHLQIGVSVIPRSSNAGRLAQNFDLFDFELSAADMASLAELETGSRIAPDPDDYEDS